jgi:2-aminoadipate transaminase
VTYNFSAAVKPGLPAPAASPWREFPQYNFVGGHNDPGSLPVDKLTAACTDVLLREGKTLATYSLESGPQGYLPLREFLVSKLNKYAGMQCHTDQILLTSGSLQAIDLINEALLAPSDTVIIETSNYGGVISRLNRLNVNMVSVDVDQHGMQTEQLAATLAQLAEQGTKPAYIYTIPTVHNPTGTIMSRQRREHLISLAAEYDVPIFEDECYADLIWDGQRPPALHALDSSGRVVHVGSFSKTIAPALRVGYVVADWSLIAQLLSLKTDAGSGALEQMLLAEYCHKHFDEHLASLNVNLKNKLDVLCRAIDREFGTAAEYTVPPGGIFLWVKLPAAVNTARLATIAEAEGVAINPGNEWSLQSDAGRHLRLCFANPDSNTIEAGIARLAEICHREFGVPVYAANRQK